MISAETIQNALNIRASRRDILRYGAGLATAGGLSAVGCSTDSDSNPRNDSTPSTQSTRSENTKNNEGILTFDDWQLEINEWTEPVSTRDGFKYVDIKCRFRNIRSKLIDSNPWDSYSFKIASDDNLYDAGREITVSTPYLPGFSLPTIIFSEVPKDKNNYSLVVSHKGEQVGKVKKGIITKELPFILPETRLMTSRDIWSLHNYADIVFDGYQTEEVKLRDTIGTYLRVVASFEIRNRREQEIAVSSLHPNLDHAYIFLDDGNTVLIGGTFDIRSNKPNVIWVLPGIDTKVDMLMVSNNGRSNDSNGVLRADDKALLKNGAIVLKLNNQAAAWQLK